MEDQIEHYQPMQDSESMTTLRDRAEAKAREALPCECGSDLIGGPHARNCDANLRRAVAAALVEFALKEAEIERAACALIVAGADDTMTAWNRIRDRDRFRAAEQTKQEHAPKDGASEELT